MCWFMEYNILNFFICQEYELCKYWFLRTMFVMGQGVW